MYLTPIPIALTPKELCELRARLIRNPKMRKLFAGSTVPWKIFDFLTEKKVMTTICVLAVTVLVALALGMFIWLFAAMAYFLNHDLWWSTAAKGAAYLKVVCYVGIVPLLLATSYLVLFEVPSWKWGTFQEHEEMRHAPTSGNHRLFSDQMFVSLQKKFPEHAQLRFGWPENQQGHAPPLVLSVECDGERSFFQVLGVV